MLSRQPNQTYCGKKKSHLLRKISRSADTEPLETRMFDMRYCHICGVCAVDPKLEHQKGHNDFYPNLGFAVMASVTYPTAATGLFCRGSKIESRLLKFCRSHATPLSGIAKCDLAKFKQSAVTFCLLIEIVRPRQCPRKYGTCQNRTRHNRWTICPNFLRSLLKLTPGTLAPETRSAMLPIP